MTRAPIDFATWTARVPVPPAAPSTTTDSPGCTFALIRSRAHAVRPWSRIAAASS